MRLIFCILTYIFRIFWLCFYTVKKSNSRAILVQKNGHFSKNWLEKKGPIFVVRSILKKKFQVYKKIVRLIFCILTYIFRIFWLFFYTSKKSNFRPILVQKIVIFQKNDYLFRLKFGFFINSKKKIFQVYKTIVRLIFCILTYIFRIFWPFFYTRKKSNFRPISKKSRRAKMTKMHAWKGLFSYIFCIPPTP